MVKTKVKHDRAKLMIDKALISMLDRAVRNFTIQDVCGEAIDIGYKFAPSGAAIFGRLDVHTKAGLLKVVRERGSGGNSRIWAFTDHSGKIRGLIRRRLDRARRRKSK